MKADFKVEGEVLIFAMRYALGRMTFAPTIAIDNIKHNISLFNVNQMYGMISDINYQVGGYGMKCDEQNWMSFKEYLKKEIAKRGSI